MTANVSSPYANVEPSRHTGTRVLVGLLGAATLVVGVVLLFNPVAAAHTLALLIGLAFVIGGLLELAVGWDSGRRWAAISAGRHPRGRRNPGRVLARRDAVRRGAHHRPVAHRPRGGAHRSSR